jgi:2,4-dienoyl-CoA reductase-like NADH-dependent reductase (Old Yellow Enzyme family)/thioredoxin reductase
MNKFEFLFKPGKIGKLEIKNRIIMSPTGSRYSTSDGYTTDHEVALWEARARGGAGLIHKTTWAFGPEVGPMFFPGHLDIYDERHAESTERFIRAIKSQGAKVTCFISHPGNHYAASMGDIPRYGPSAVADPITGIAPKAMSMKEVQDFVNAYAEGARRAKMLGFDGVLIQGGHGMLVHQFLSPKKNCRTDEYGGSVVNRARFACEIIKRTREKVGPDFPILIRLNGDDHFRGGIRIEDTLEQAPLFVNAGADALDISSGPREAHQWQYVTYLQPSGSLVPFAAAIKKVVDIPVCTVGKIDPALAEEILEAGYADFIDFCRPLLADPELPNKVKEGRITDICPCIHCNQCHETMRTDPPLGIKPSGRFYCSINPAFGWEREYERSMKKAPTPKKVIVIGGGPAGMEAARTLAERGHRTFLYEKTSRLGGQWTVVTAYRPEETRLIEYLARGMDRAGVNVFLNKEVTPALVTELKPDAVVLATGSRPLSLAVPGNDCDNVVFAADVLLGKARVGSQVVIIGGRNVGADTALFLAKQGKKVSIVSRRAIARGLHHTIQLAYDEYFIELGVYAYPDSTVEGIMEDGVSVFYHGGMMFLKADTVVLAVGYQSNNALADQLRDQISEIHMVGDCKEPRDVLAAINEGSAAGRAI